MTDNCPQALSLLQLKRYKPAVKILTMEPTSGFEPETPSLPWKCSTTELCRQKYLLIVAKFPCFCYNLELLNDADVAQLVRAAVL